MAKKAKANGVNKSEAIREYIKANPDIGPKDGAEAVSNQLGIEISPAFYSQIKTKQNKASGSNGKAGKVKGVRKSNVAKVGGNLGAVALIRAARTMLQEAGSVEAAKAVLDEMGA